MKKIGIIISTFIAFSLMHTQIFAQEHGFYLLGKAGSGVQREHGLSFHPFKENTPSHEAELLSKQISEIVHHVDKSLLTDLWLALRNTSNLSDLMYEGGFGYRTHLVTPIALEFKGSHRNIDTSSQLFYAGAFKIFLPLSSRNKLYLSLSKPFQMSHKFDNASLFDDRSILWKDIKNTIWKRPPNEQWKNSLTALGIGLVRKISSKIEVDVLLEGYTNRERKECYFTTSLGFNYIF